MLIVLFFYYWYVYKCYFGCLIMMKLLFMYCFMGNVLRGDFGGESLGSGGFFFLFCVFCRVFFMMYGVGGVWGWGVWVFLSFLFFSFSMFYLLWDRVLYLGGKFEKYIIFILYFYVFIVDWYFGDYIDLFFRFFRRL